MHVYYVCRERVTYSDTKPGKVCATQRSTSVSVLGSCLNVHSSEIKTRDCAVFVSVVDRSDKKTRKKT
jgi:hypothetical protein